LTNFPKSVILNALTPSESFLKMRRKVYPTNFGNPYGPKINFNYFRNVNSYLLYSIKNIILINEYWKGHELKYSSELFKKAYE